MEDCCAQSYKGFTTCEQMEKHERSHTEQNIVLKEEMIPKKVGTLLFCSQCSEVFSRKDHLKRHLTRPKHLNFRNNAYDAIRKLSGDTIFCSKCDKTFQNFDELAQHKISHNGETMFSCSQCKKVFSRRNYFTKHLKTKEHLALVNNIKIPEAIRKPRTCTKCGEVFSRHRNLKKHQRDFSGESLFSCPQCDKKFCASGSLIKHKGIHTKFNGEDYYCDACDYKCISQRKMKRHTIYKHRGSLFVCDKCEKQFTTKQHLLEHIKVKHEGVRISCHQCDYKTTTKTYLNVHIKVKHEGERFECEYCDFQANFPNSIIAHKKLKHKLN